jgi:hypothetical protein
VITIVGHDGIMPQEYHFACILVNLFEEALTLKICFILAEVHIVGVAESAVHYG